MPIELNSVELSPNLHPSSFPDSPSGRRSGVRQLRLSGLSSIHSKQFEFPGCREVGGGQLPPLCGPKVAISDSDPRPNLPAFLQLPEDRPQPCLCSKVRVLGPLPGFRPLQHSPHCAHFHTQSAWPPGSLLTLRGCRAEQTTGFSRLSPHPA